MRNALVHYKDAVHRGRYSGNLELGEMYHGGEGTAVNMKRAILHFEISAHYDDHEAHWNLGCIYFF